MNDSAGHRKEWIAGQEVVDLPGGLPALGNGPHDQGLTAAAVPGREHALHRGAELAGLGVDVGSRVLKMK